MATFENPIDPPAPTQVAHPWRATIRTGAAFLMALMLTIIAAWPIIDEQMGAYLGPDVRGAILAFVGFLGALTATITRLMANPAVNDLLTRVGLGAAPYEGEHRS